MHIEARCNIKPEREREREKEREREREREKEKERERICICNSQLKNISYYLNTHFKIKLMYVNLNGNSDCVFVLLFCLLF